MYSNNNRDIYIHVINNIIQIEPNDIIVTNESRFNPVEPSLIRV